MAPNAGANAIAAIAPTTHATSAINSRITPRANASSVDSPTTNSAIQSNEVMVTSRPDAAACCIDLLFDGGDNAALPFGLQLVARGDRRLARTIGTDAHAPQRPLAGLQRFRICGITGALQATGECVRALVVGERGELHGEAIMRGGRELGCVRGDGCGRRPRTCSRRASGRRSRWIACGFPTRARGLGWLGGIARGFRGRISRCGCDGRSGSGRSFGNSRVVLRRAFSRCCSTRRCRRRGLVAGPRRGLACVLRAAVGEAIDELAVVDGRNLDRDVVAERFLLGFEQHRHDDRDAEREDDCANQAAPRAPPQFVYVDVRRFRHDAARFIASLASARAASNACATSSKRRIASFPTPAASSDASTRATDAPRGPGSGATYQASTRGASARATASMSLSASMPNTANVRG